jgi:hypothetical protein
MDRLKVPGAQGCEVALLIGKTEPLRKIAAD